MEPVIATIVSALIAATASIVVCIINNKKQLATITTLISYRLEQLEKQVEKHNKLVERTYKLEEQVAVQEEKQKVADHRISDLEKKVS